MTDDTLPPLFQDGRTLLIAEVGSNHAGDPVMAKEGIHAAKEAGADVVKYQLYQAEQLVDDKMPVLKYIAQTHKTQRERFKSLQMPESVFVELAEEAVRVGIHFMVTPFYPQAVEFLDPLVPAFKIASGDLTNKELLEACVATGKPLILSTGLSDLGEIDWAVERVPKDRLHLLHCVGAYPTPDDQVNLNAIPFLRERYGVPVGFSDHSVGSTACIAAVALGATVIEKHFLPCDDLTPADKALSIGVAAFADMAAQIRRIEAMRGTSGKDLQPDEAYFRTTLRRSVYTNKDIPAGAAVERDSLVPLRPWAADGISPQNIDRVVGRTARRDLVAGTMLREDDLA